MATTEEQLFTAIDHVGLAVPDLDAAVAFHRETFGLRLLHEEVNVEQGVREAMMGVGTLADAASSAPGGGGDPQDQRPHAALQLLAPLGPDSPIARFLERSGPGVQQVAYRVRDVEHVADVLRARGLRLLYETARRGTAGSRVNFVHPKDTGGVLLELVEPAPLAPGPVVGGSG